MLILTFYNLCNTLYKNLFETLLNLNFQNKMTMGTQI